jgi:hypothetical protein
MPESRRRACSGGRTKRLCGTAATAFVSNAKRTTTRLPSALAAAVLGVGLLIDATGEAHADALCNNGTEKHPTCHPIGPPDPTKCGSPSGPEYSYMCDEYGFLHKLSLDGLPAHDPTAVVKAGYVVCAITGPSDYVPSDVTLYESSRSAAVSRVAAGPVVTPGDADQLVTDAIEWLC